MLRFTLLVPLAALALALPGVAAARPDPVTWCGTDEVTANRVPDLEVSDGAQVHVVYAVPSDGADRFSAVASGIATDVAWIDQWWQGQDASRTPRFDRYPFPGCTSTFGALDLGFVRLPNTQDAYMNASDSYGALLTDLTAALKPDALQKTLVYYDGRIADPDTCGQSNADPTQGGQDGFSILYMQSACGNATPGEGGSSQIAAHELTHDLGAVPPQAPNTCAQFPGHVCDSTSDLLYPFYTDGLQLDQVSLDVNHDDYYAHSGSWWDVQDSRWLEHLPQAPFTISKTGNGTVGVLLGGSVSPPCGGGCMLQLDSGLQVRLMATPVAGSRFVGWSGACTGTIATCLVTTSGAASVSAIFALQPRAVRVSITGRGSVRSTPAGLACSARCGHAFPATAKVTLTAKPARGWQFVRWTGTSCGTTARCLLPARGSVTAGARFARR
jgi:Divergent InlB B-repeat domain